MTPQCTCKNPEITRDNPKVCKKCGWFIDYTICNRLRIDEYQTSEQEQLMQSGDKFFEEPERRFFEIKPTYSDKTIEKRKPSECFGRAVSAGQKAKRLRMMKRKK